MNIPIQQLLKPEELATIRELIAQSEFEDGKKTASGTAQTLKANLQLKAESESAMKIGEIVRAAMRDSPLLMQAFMPHRIYNPIVSKYKDGMNYGWHTDGPVMGKEKTRTDLAMTLFISDPDTYDGGELVLQTSMGQVPYKLAGGDAIVYPAVQLHCVNPVTKGERVAVVTWMQSQVRDNAQRELLFQMTQVIASLNQKRLHDEEMALLQCYSNLQRMWVEV